MHGKIRGTEPGSQEAAIGIADANQKFDLQCTCAYMNKLLFLNQN